MRQKWSFLAHHIYVVFTEGKNNHLQKYNKTWRVFGFVLAVFCCIWHRERQKYTPDQNLKATAKLIYIIYI